MCAKDELAGRTHLRVNKSYSRLWDDILRSRCLLQYYRFNDWQRKTGRSLHHSTADLSKAVKSLDVKKFFTLQHYEAVIVFESEA